MAGPIAVMGSIASLAAPCASARRQLRIHAYAPSKKLASLRPLSAFAQIDTALICGIFLRGFSQRQGYAWPHVRINGRRAVSLEHSPPALQNGRAQKSMIELDCRPVLSRRAFPLDAVPRMGRRMGAEVLQGR
jgi:hypothetical protein